MYAAGELGSRALNEISWNFLQYLKKLFYTKWVPKHSESAWNLDVTNKVNHSPNIVKISRNYVDSSTEQGTLDDELIPSPDIATGI